MVAPLAFVGLPRRIRPPLRDLLRWAERAFMKLWEKPGDGGREMDEAVYREMEQLQQMQVEELRERYQAVFGEPVRSKHKQHLVRRIAWRLQVLAQGDLSERARQRALAIANDADLRVQVPSGWIASQRTAQKRKGGPKDRRLPAVGTVLSRTYGDQTLVVKVLPDGFEYQGRHYRSLSAIAREATGTRWNGLLFFGLTKRGKGTKRAAQ